MLIKRYGIVRKISLGAIRDYLMKTPSPSQSCSGFWPCECTPAESPLVFLVIEASWGPEYLLCTKRGLLESTGGTQVNILLNKTRYKSVIVGKLWHLIEYFPSLPLIKAKYRQTIHP